MEVTGSEITVDTGRENYDFGLLPEVAWVQIMQYLQLKDRYSLSITCQALYQHFYHPSLWSNVKVNLTGGSTNFSLSNTYIPNRLVQMIDKFGHLFQKLTIKIFGHVSTFDDDSRLILTKLSEVCRLESLTLEAGKLITQFDISGFPPFKSDIQIFINFINNAFRLKQLNIRSWPMYPAIFTQNNLNIFNAIVKNEKLKDLESLSLFWRDDSAWSEREPLLPSPSFLMTFLPDLKKLTHLAVRSPMLNEDILTMLSSPDRCRLKLLQIYVTYSAFNQAFQIPDISSDIWKTLVLASPELEVECSVMSQVPNPELSLLLCPEVPLKSITFLPYSRCNGQIIGSITDKFMSSLKDFICYADTSDVDIELRYLVSKCSGLRTLVFHGSIKCSTVVTMATQKSGQWSKLEFVEKKLDTFDDEDGDDVDADEAIRRNEAGEYILVGLHRFHRHDDNREETIEQMSSVVSGVMGYKWKPV
ncbi:F-box/LRR-repeat protein 21-like [Haliotis cracherodii]|uniref:F-box/LRR-repeat protein 21-like n=1 Tax=Haliotis cracherodii TaxID=6455 RepID=UPI0039EB9237